MQSLNAIVDWLDVCAVLQNSHRCMCASCAVLWAGGTEKKKTGRQALLWLVHMPMALCISTICRCANNLQLHVPSEHTCCELSASHRAKSQPLQVLAPIFCTLY